MGEHRKGVWEHVREHATHWAIGGVLIAPTGFAPEEWLGRALDDLRIPSAALHLWNAGIDIRLLPICLGVAFIVGDVWWRRARTAKPASHGSASSRAVSALDTMILNDATGALALPERPSIAVLPFDNLSGDPDQEYFSDGVAGDIVTELSRDRLLIVIARTSSFTYRDRDIDVKHVGRELNVRYIVEGSVRRDAGRIRVTAELIDADTGSHLWAERYDRALEDVFAVQDEISAAVTAALRPAITGAEQRRAASKPPASLDAWESYQRGMWHLARANRADNETAKQFFRRAIEQDRDFAAAYAAMTWACGLGESVFAARPFAGWGPEAATWARRAVEAAPDDANAQAAMVRIMFFAGDSAAAAEHVRAALASDPNLPSAISGAGLIQIFTGEPASGRVQLENALRLDPHGPSNAVNMGLIAASYYLEHDYDAAVEAARRVIHRYPDYPLPYRWLAASLAQAGRTEEAAVALRQALALAPGFFDVHGRRRPAYYYRQEDYDHMLEGLRKAGWEG